MKKLFLCIFMLWAISLVFGITPPGYCTTLTATPQARLTNPCVYVVDYSFFVPNGYTLSMLQRRAQDSLNNTQLLSLSSNCQGALVRYTCALIYRKCQPGIVLDTVSTYNYNIYANDTGAAVPLPIQRPCVSVCTALSTICADPLFVFAANGYPNCYAKTNYANLPIAQPYRFDLKNDATKCYSPRLIPLSGPKELYRGPNMPCSGIVDEFFMLPGNKLNPNFTVLQPANVIQNLLNTGLSSSFQNFPKWLTEDCNAAIRQYFCYQYFFKAQAVTIRQGLIAGVIGTPYQGSLTQIQTVANSLYPGLLDRALYFPRYANHSICENYYSICWEFRFRAENPLLEPNCSKTTAGLRLFPAKINQTILTRKFSVSLGGNAVALNLKFNTAPYYTAYRNDSQLDYTIKCPPKYSVNPDYEDDRIDAVPGTGCAVNCRTGFWTDDEWSSFDSFNVAVSSVSLVFSVIVIIVIIATSDWKVSYLIIFFTITSLISSLYQLAVTAGAHWEERFCYSDVLRRRKDTGPSNCMRHATLSSFLYLAGCIIVFLMSLQRTLELTGNQAVLFRPSYSVFQCLIAMLPPLVAVALAWVKGYLGFGGATPWCSMDLIPSVYLMGFPVLVICGFSYGVYIYGTYYSRQGNHPSKVAIANTATKTDSGNASVGAGANNNSSVAKPTSGMTVISIGATVDVSPVRAFDEEEVPNNSNAAVATAAVPSDIEMKQLAANGAVSESSAVANNEAAVEADSTVMTVAVSTKPVMGDTAAHALRMDIILSSFVAGSIIIHIGWVILKFGNYTFGSDYYDSFVTYTRCIFRNWDTQTDSSFESVCGFHPSDRPDTSSIQFYSICLFGNMLVMGPIYLLSSLYAYYRTKGNSSAASTNLANNKSTARSSI